MQLVLFYSGSVCVRERKECHWCLLGEHEAISHLLGAHNARSARAPQGKSELRFCCCLSSISSRHLFRFASFAYVISLSREKVSHELYVLHLFAPNEHTAPCDHQQILLCEFEIWTLKQLINQRFRLNIAQHLYAATTFELVKVFFSKWFFILNKKWHLLGWKFFFKLNFKLGSGISMNKYKIHTVQVILLKND